MELVGAELYLAAEFVRAFFSVLLVMLLRSYLDVTGMCYLTKKLIGVYIC